MKFCPKCGKQIDATALFCPHCGSSQTSTPQPSQVPARGTNNRRLHCPKCKEYQLSPIVETDVQGGYAVGRSLGSKWGASAIDLKSTHKNYWICQSCGHKFRQLDNLESELASQTKAKKWTWICFIVAAVYSLLCLFSGVGLLCVLMIPCAILLAVLWVHFNNNTTKLTQEKQYLEKNCFD